jgi:hypothetical protein
MIEFDTSLPGRNMVQWPGYWCPAVPRRCSESGKKGCGQCPHFWLRTRPYIGRFGPDSVCFRGSPMFARAGIQFESHLGHSMTPRQRGFCFNVWTLTLLGPSDAVRGLCLAPRGPIRLCGWRGQALAGGPSACWNLGYVASFLAVPLASCWSSFMATSCVDDMTKPKIFEDPPRIAACCEPG